MTTKNFRKSLFSSLFLVALLVLPYFVFADTVKGDTGVMSRLQRVGDQSGFSAADERTLASSLGVVVNAVLSLLGIIFIILVIVGGFQWMTAGGNEEKVAKAKKNVTNAVIGLIITISAYAIWSLIDRLFIGKM